MLNRYRAAVQLGLRLFAFFVESFDAPRHARFQGCLSRTIVFEKTPCLGHVLNMDSNSSIGSAWVLKTRQQCHSFFFWSGSVLYESYCDLTNASARFSSRFSRDDFVTLLSVRVGRVSSSTSSRAQIARQSCTGACACACACKLRLH